MAAGFRHRLTALTVPTRAALLRRTRARKLSYARVRCSSLPGRFHPAVAGLHESASALIAWTAEAPAQQAASPAWLGTGAAHLGRLLAGLDGLLHHPQGQDPLIRRRGGKPAVPWADRLLDDLLLLADAHACFRDAMLALRRLLADAHAALRRRDAARLAAAVRARRRSDRDLARLAATLRCLSHRSSSSSAAAPSDPGEAAVAEAAAAATCAAAAAAAAIFAGLASASASSSSRAMPSPLAAVSPAKVAAVPVWWVVDLLRWRWRTVAVAAASESREVPLEDCCSEEEEERQAAMERLRRLEDCVVAAEDGCEQVYRALVGARVSLLNLLTPCF